MSSSFANGATLECAASYDVSPDGQRFLISGAAENATPPAITVIVNWPSLLK